MKVPVVEQHESYSCRKWQEDNNWDRIPVPRGFTPYPNKPRHNQQSIFQEHYDIKCRHFLTWIQFL